MERGRRERSPFKWRNPLWALTVLACGAAALGGSASATTLPGKVYTIHAVLTDTTVKLVPESKLGGNFIEADGRSAQFPRGAIINFKFVNKGSKPYLPALKILDTSQLPPLPPGDRGKYFTAHRVVAPGGRVEFIVTFSFRGPFSLLELLHKKPHGQTVHITVY